MREIALCSGFVLLGWILAELFGAVGVYSLFVICYLTLLYRVWGKGTRFDLAEETPLCAELKAILRAFGYSPDRISAVRRAKSGAKELLAAEIPLAIQRFDPNHPRLPLIAILEIPAASLTALFAVHVARLGRRPEGNRSWIAIGLGAWGLAATSIAMVLWIAAAPLLFGGITIFLIGFLGLLCLFILQVIVKLILWIKHRKHAEQILYGDAWRAWRDASPGENRDALHFILAMLEADATIYQAELSGIIPLVKGNKSLMLFLTQELGGYDAAKLLIEREIATSRPTQAEAVAVPSST